MLNLILRRGNRGLAGWCASACAMLVISSMASLVVTSPAAEAGTLAPVFSFDLNQTDAGVVEGDGAYQGTFFGTTIYTSLSYGGAIYKFSTNDSVPKTLYQFQSTDGYRPGSLVLASDHYLYGVTRYAPRLGSDQDYGYGTIFRIAQDGTGFQTLHTFADDGSEGTYPSFRLTDGNDGYLYGVAPSGGNNGTGTVFRIQLGNSGNFQVIHHFAALGTDNTNADGATPASELMLSSDGFLYGVTSLGGSQVWTTSSGNTSTGTIYRLERTSTDSVEHLFSFDALDDTNDGTNETGVKPQGGLVEVSANVFLGTASDGGEIGYGTIYRLDMSSGSADVTALHDFDGTSGSAPIGSMLQVSTDGRYYGVTSTGTSTDSSTYSAYGVVYAFEPDSGTTGTYEPVYRLGFGDGSSPTRDGLIEASNGDLYGSTQYAGACTATYGSGYGTVFRYSVSGASLPGGYSSCTPSSSSGGGAMTPGLLLLLCALGCAPLPRRLLLGR